MRIETRQEDNVTYFFKEYLDSVEQETTSERVMMV
jgi:hypothetical protein